jgi:hypothetical protein
MIGKGMQLLTGAFEHFVIQPFREYYVYLFLILKTSILKYKDVIGQDPLWEAKLFLFRSLDFT